MTLPVQLAQTSIYCMALEGSQLYCGTKEGEILALDEMTGKTKQSFKLPGSPAIKAITVASGIIYVSTKNAIFCVQSPQKITPIGTRIYPDFIETLMVSNNKLIGGSKKGSLYEWTITLLDLPPYPHSCHSDAISRLVALANSIFCSGSWDATIGVWNLDTMHLLHRLEAHHSPICDLTYNTHLYSLSYDGSLCIWNNTDFKLLKTVTGNPAQCLASADEKLHLGLLDGSVEILDTKTNKRQILTLSQQSPVIQVIVKGKSSYALTQTGNIFKQSSI